MLRPDIEALTDGLDAAVFSGDAFHDGEHRKHLREMLARWSRELDVLDLEVPVPSERDLKTAARLKEVQDHLGYSDAEMDNIMKPKMYPWAHYTKTGIASAMILGRACRLTGWTMAYMLGETDDKTHDPVAVRGIACKRNGEGCVPYTVMRDGTETH